MTQKFKVGDIVQWSSPDAYLVDFVVQGDLGSVTRARPNHNVQVHWWRKGKKLIHTSSGTLSNLKLVDS